MSVEREMSLAEWCAKLPPFHLANVELKELREQVEKLTKERDELKTVPMKYRRMQFNAELQDEVTQLQKQLAALAEQNERQSKALNTLLDISQVSHVSANTLESVCRSALSLPDLATPVLNRKKENPHD